MRCRSGNFPVHRTHQSRCQCGHPDPNGYVIRIAGNGSAISARQHLCFVVQPDDGKAFGFGEFNQQWVLLAAGNAPGSPRLSNQTLPNMSFDENCAPAPSRIGAVNTGEGLPISGEGISRGSRVKPMARKTTSTMKDGQRYQRFFHAATAFALAIPLVSTCLANFLR